MHGPFQLFQLLLAQVRPQGFQQGFLVLVDGAPLHQAGHLAEQIGIDAPVAGGSRTLLLHRGRRRRLLVCLLRLLGLLGL